MKKILVVLTGGTIAGTVSERVIEIKGKSQYRIISDYEELYGKNEEFDVISPLSILSENLKPDMWNILFNTIFEKDLNKYRGIIITHGTDTLSYTSAMAGFMLGYLNIPVVLVASGKPLGEKGSNGLENFKNAVCIINQNISGVFTVYSDANGTNNVYLATRILEADRYNDEFRPFGNSPYGTIRDGYFAKAETKINDFELKPIERICKKLNLQSNVMMIKPYPGLNYRRINTNGCKAVLHTLYHSSTAEEIGLQMFAEECAKNDIDLYLCCFKNDMSKMYSSMKNILLSEVVPLKNISEESAYAKLLIAYNTDMDKREFMNKNIYYEIL